MDTLLFFLFLQFSLNTLSAQAVQMQQDLRFENFSTPRKVITGSAGNIMVDTKGYVWICSDALYRFDGWNTTKYNSADASGRGLLNNYCDDLINDEFGRLWIGNLAGLCYYDNSRDSIIYLQKNKTRSILFAFSFLIKDKELWFVSNLGLCRLDLETLAISTTSLTEIKDPTGTYSLSADELGISSREAFYVFNTKTNSYRKKQFVVDNRVIHINDIEQKKNVFWIATNAGLMTTTDFSTLHLVNGSSPVFINSLHFHPGDNSKKYLWVGTARSGLRVFNTETMEQSFNYVHHPSAPFSIPSDNIYKLSGQKNGNLWIGTEKGISLLQLQNQAYQTRLLTFDNNSTDNHIGLSVHDKYDTGIVWLACQHQGLIAVNWSNKEVYRQYKNITAPGTGLSVLDMAQLTENKWLLLFPYRLAVWNKYTGIEKTARIHATKDVPTSIRFTKLVKGNDSLVYIASNVGLFLYKTNTNDITQVIQKDDPESTLHSAMDLQNGFVDRNGNLWLASRSGLVNYDPDSKKISVFQQTIAGNELKNFLNDVVPGNNNTIYCAGLDGISIFDMNSKKFANAHLNGINRVNCFALLKDTNVIWANTNAGLLMIDLEKNENRRYVIPGPADNYSFSNISRINNELVIGFRDAYAYFNLSVLSRKETPGSPVIESVSINNELHFFGTNDYLLKNWQNNIKITFTAFEYSDASTIQFRYKLSGMEEKWNYIGKERSIQFVRLSPGKYNLLLQSGNNAGWNENSTALSFVIRPAFWQSWWFRSLVIVSILLAAFFGMKSRVKNIRRQAAIRQGMAELEMKALRAQMNPHFIFNCMATADGLILQNKKAEASAFLHKFSSLVRMVLENSVHSLVPLQKDLAPLHLYIQLEQERNQYNFDYAIEVDPELDPADICIPPLLLQPFAENAILHGLRHLTDKKGMLLITIAKKGDHIIYSIDDNGVGRARSASINRELKHNKQSLGQHVTVTRIQTMNHLYGNRHSIEVIDKPGEQGTSVIITLPYLSNCS